MKKLRWLYSIIPVTETPVRSELVVKLFQSGRAKDLEKAIDNSKETGIGHYKGITVKRLGF